jgi:hypothetical protein
LYKRTVKVTLHPIFGKYETKVTMASIIIFKRAGYRIEIVSKLFLFASMWGADDSVLIQGLFCGPQID